jgi:hypothetical protein
LWLPNSDAIKQIKKNHNITGIALCYRSLEEINAEISNKFPNIEVFLDRYKRIPDETKSQIARLIKNISLKGFIVSVSIPANLFEHCDNKRKATSVCYALINTILNKVLSEKNKAGFENINIHVLGRGELNNGIDSRINRIIKETVSSATTVNSRILKIDDNSSYFKLDKILGLTCWFIDQSKESNKVNSRWLQEIKGLV